MAKSNKSGEKSWREAWSKKRYSLYFWSNNRNPNPNPADSGPVGSPFSTARLRLSSMQS